MNERIKKIRIALKLSQTDFAKKLSVSRSAICKMESGENSPSEQTIKLICNEFDVSEEWLRTGNGEMFIPKIPNDEISNMLADVLKLENKDFRKRLLVALSKLDSDGWHELEKFIDSISNPSPPDEEE